MHLAVRLKDNTGIMAGLPLLTVNGSFLREFISAAAPIRLPPKT